jgi:hypothetical protein
MHTLAPQLFYDLQTPTAYARNIFHRYWVKRFRAQNHVSVYIKTNTEMTMYVTIKFAILDPKSQSTTWKKKIIVISDIWSVYLCIH